MNHESNGWLKRWASGIENVAINDERCQESVYTRLQLVKGGVLMFAKTNMMFALANRRITMQTSCNPPVLPYTCKSVRARPVNVSCNRALRFFPSPEV